MKILKLLSVFAFMATVLTSCYSEVIVQDDYIHHTNPTPAISINQLLNSYELWYVDINETLGYGESPFLQIAFTVSFRNGTLYANNNLVGIGSQGNGFGVPIGYYNAYDRILDIDHDIDGYDSFDVYQVDYNTIELYNPFNDTSYFLNGFQRSNFDYDYVFYDNLQYFMQEYEAWEKTYTSEYGVLNEFDNENYLQFLSGGSDNTFRSSQDANGLNPEYLYWDFTGNYNVGAISGNMYLKTLTLDYDYFDNEFFELSVINDQRVKLFHAASGTVYEFTGRGYIEFLKEGQTINKSKPAAQKKRVQRSTKKENPRDNSRE